MPVNKERYVRQIFVIMPFSNTPTRNLGQLTSFFESSIKAPIERENFKYKYQVRRSDATFDINTQIIKDLFTADIVICDLSGTQANPNVMYELGIRLGLSNDPVLLIREKHIDNKQIFDINGFNTFPYDPLNYWELTQYLIGEIKGYEEGKRTYESPILAIIKGGIPYLQAVSIQRADLLLKTMRDSIKMMTRLFVKQFAKYISYHLKMEIPENFFDLSVLLEYMEKNRERFSEADWTKFRVSFGSQPTMDLYLSNQYLNGLVDIDFERIFTGFLITYHSYFVSTSYYSGEWNHMNVYRFLGETNILLKSTKLIRIMLKTEAEKEKDELLILAKGILKTSHIYSFEDITESTINTSSNPV